MRDVPSRVTMEQTSPAASPSHFHASIGPSSLDHVRGTTYESIGVGGNAQAHFGDRYQQNHGLVINANNVDINDNVLHQLVRLDLDSASKQRTFGLCLGQAPQIEQDAFIGRRNELRQLQEWFSQDKKTQIVVSIVGMGGLGKTQLSLAYARKYKEQYTSIFWVNAKDEVSLRQSFSTLASIVSIKAGTLATNIGEEKMQVDLVRRWLSEDWNYEWLMIFDNYDDPNLPNIRSPTGFDIRSYFPHRTQGHILITTRSPKLTFSKRLTLQKFDDINSGLAVLTQRAGRDLATDVDARRLALRLDGLPLALATAGTYLSQTGVSCAEYLDAYESAWIDLYGPGTEELLEYEDRTLSSTWNVSFDQVGKADADAAELFKFWAYFSNKDVWYELIRAGAESGPAWMSRVTANKIRFDRAMTKLQDYSLVEVMSGSYSIHPCTHVWISEHFDIDQTEFLAAAKSITNTIPELTSSQYWTITKRLLSHIDRLTGNRFHMFWELSMSDEKALKYNIALAGILCDWEYLEDAELMYVRALTQLEQTLGHNHILTLSVLGDLATLYAKHNWNSQKAEELYMQAMTRCIVVLGLDSLQTLSIIGNLGRLYHDQGKLEQAEEMYLRVLAETESAVRLNHAFTLDNVNDLGLVYMDQGKFVQAEQILLQALSEHEKILGCDHMSTLQVVRNLGRLYHKQGRLKEVEQMYLQALAGLKRTAGSDHVTTLEVTSQLGALYIAQGNLNRAEEILSRSLSKFQDGNPEVEIPGTIGHLATILRQIVRTRADDLQQSRHELARLVRLAKNPHDVSQSTVIYSLARALFWIKDEENYLVAFSQVIAECDGCYCPIYNAQGQHICRQCDAIDLCNDCMAKYRDGSLVLPDCNGHDYFDVDAAVSESLESPAQLSTEAKNAWIDRLEEKYSLVTEDQD